MRRSGVIRKDDGTQIASGGGDPQNRPMHSLGPKPGWSKFFTRTKTAKSLSVLRATALKSFALGVLVCRSVSGGENLEHSFAHPPDSARPWVWAHWLHGNVSKDSITRELEAIKRVGLGGVTMFDAAQPGIPAGPHKYMEESWREMFGHEVREAKRLGLEIMSQVGPGYSGNGGPWISLELAAQKIVESATRVTGGRRYSGVLPQPECFGGYYRDVAVLAINETEAQSKFRIEGLDMKRLVWLNYIRWRGVASAPLSANVPAEVCIPRKNIVDVTSAMAADGSFAWDAPAGTWTILRFGHTWTGQKTLPATPEGLGPECDKLDRRGIQAHFNHVMQRMIELAGPAAGNTFHTFFVDSWEAGGQNWTRNMPEEFRRRRGYDLIPFLPVITGRVVGDLQTAERLLYDLRQTVSELVAENFWAELQRLCHARGMKVAVQPYITTGNDLDAANFTDEPMGEFWALPNTTTDYRQTVKSAVSAADLNQRTIVGVEAYTSTAMERWQSHPATLKALGDEIFCLGANRFQIHRFAMQRFPQLKPGLMMGGWGQQYDSTQTWWEWSKPWHDYLARCQLLLRQGPVVADVLTVVPEEPLFRFEHKPIAGYDYDACGPDAFKRITLHEGKPGLPSGRTYRLMVVEHTGTMTLGRLRQIRELVTHGANLLGEPPLATPGLENLPQADDELRALAAEIWGDAGETDRRCGQGRVFRGMSPADALAKLSVTPDFIGPDKLAWIHRADGDRDFYFIASSADKPIVANCTFRVQGRPAELWNPVTGTIQPLDPFEVGSDRTIIHVPLDPRGSAFIVFSTNKSAPRTIASIRHNDRAVFPPVASTNEAVVRSEARGTIELGTTADGRRSGLIHCSGDYVIQFASGEKRTHRSINVPASQPVTGPWALAFPQESGVRETLTLPALTSWSSSPDSNVRHFSGTAVYRNTFNLSAVDSQVVLDLGRVEIMARVRVNGQEFETLWKPPYRVDITRAARAGSNTLEIAVVNLWVNRLIGDAAMPDDAERDASGRLKTWPQWLLEGRTSPTGRQSFVTFPLWKKGEALKESGLLGPVILHFPVAISF